MVVVRDASRSDDLLAVAEPLARRPSRELILVHLVQRGDELSEGNAMLARLRRDLDARGISARVAAYTTLEPGDDAALLAAEHDADLVLVDAPVQLVGDSRVDDDLATILANAPCDVGVLTGSGTAQSGPVVTPFGGVEHDWSAIEVAAWLAQSLQTTLRLLGTEADLAAGRRDASRLLARASLLVQQVIGIVTEPVLVPPASKAFSMPRATHDCSSSASPSAGRPKASGACASPSLPAPARPRSSYAADCDQRASRRTGPLRGSVGR